MMLLDQLLARLIKADVEFVLVGGLAASIHGSSLNTRDVDVCCRFTQDNLMRIQSAFEGLHPVHRMRPDMPLALTPDQCGHLKNLYIKTDLGVVDCLSEVIALGGFDEVRRQSLEIEMPVGRFRILEINALIKSKEALGRPNDLIAAQHLKALKSRLPQSAADSPEH